MNITLHKSDAVNGRIAVEVCPEDYQLNLEKSLNDIRKNAVFAGFRKGNVPKSHIVAKYRKTLLVEELNKVVQENLLKYVQDNGLSLLGEPLLNPKESSSSEDLQTKESFSFVYDVGLMPEMNIKLTRDDKIPYYVIAVPDSFVENQIKNYRANYGSHIPVDAAESTDLVKGNMVEQDGSLTVDSAILMPFYMKDEAEREKFIGAKIGDVIVFNPYTAYEGQASELSAFLKIDKTAVEAHTGDFTFTVNEITRYQEAELNQELYDKIFAPGLVTSEESLKDRVKAVFERRLAERSDRRFVIDARKLLEEKTKDICFPDEFLKRWLMTSDPKNTRESIEESYPGVLADLKFHFIKEQTIKEYGLQVTDEEIAQQALALTRIQLAPYNISDPEVVKGYVQSVLSDQENIRKINQQLMDIKIIQVFKEQASLQFKNVSLEEFEELFKEQ